MNTQNVLKVEIECKGVSAGTLVSQLRTEMQQLDHQNIELSVPPGKKQPGTLALDPTVVVALITGGTSVVSATIAALVTLIGKRKTGAITLSLPDGSKLEFPVTLSSAEIDRIAGALHGTNGGKIIISE